jgi:predicted CopG family antitoxin
MAHKTITISEEAYNALAFSEQGRESFTDVILRVTSGKGKASLLLKIIESLPPDEELARNVEEVMKRSRKAKPRRVRL